MKSVCLALCAAILLSGCVGRKESQAAESAKAVQAVRNEVEHVVADAGRKEKALSAVDRLEAELMTFSRAAATFQGSLHVLNANPLATRAQFDDVIARFEAERKVTRARLLQIHMDLLAATTEGEWRSIGKREAEIVHVDDPARAAPEMK